MVYAIRDEDVNCEYAGPGGRRPPKKGGVVPPHSKAGEAPAVAPAISGWSVSRGKAAGRLGVRRHDAALPAEGRHLPLSLWERVG